VRSGFCIDLNESLTDSVIDDSLLSPLKGSLLIDTTFESASSSTEIEKPADETKIALDWSTLAGLSSAKKSQQASRITQVNNLKQKDL